MQGAARVGFLIIIFVGLLYGGYAFLGRSLLRPKTNLFIAEFADAGGTTAGTGVTMAGVKIGSVKSVALESPQLAKLTFEIDGGVQIPRGSVARLGSSLIGLGSNPIQIVPPEKLTGYLSPGDVIPGAKGSPLESYLPPEARDTLKELNLTLAATRKILENQTLQNKVAKLMDDSSVTLSKFSLLAGQAQGLLGKADRIVGANQALIASAMHNASLAMADIRKSTALLTKLIESGKYQDQALTLLKQLNETSKKADELVTGLNNFVGDPHLQANLKDTVANVTKMSDSGTRIAANTEEISKNGITLSEKAIQLADKANAIADEARTALDKITGFITKGGAKPTIPKVKASLDLLRETDPNRWRTDLNARVQLDKNFLDVGLYDAFETNKVILQYGEPFGRRTDLRYGIYASKPGVGVDFRVAPRVSLRTDLFDINKPRFDLRTQLDFGNGFVGWLGLERIFDRNAFAVGIGIKK